MFCHNSLTRCDRTFCVTRFLKEYIGKMDVSLPQQNKIRPFFEREKLVLLKKKFFAKDLYYAMDFHSNQIGR